MKIATFHQLLVHKIQSIYDGENQIIEALPTLIDSASSVELRKSFQNHLKETQDQVEKLEELCDLMNIELEGLSNLAMEGMIDDTMEIIQNSDRSPILDAALVASAQNIEHYEISCYGAASEWAERMGHSEAKNTLGEILAEEKATDKLLTQIAENIISNQAADMGGQVAIGRTG